MEFESRVALEALKNPKTLSELVVEYEVHYSHSRDDSQLPVSFFSPIGNEKKPSPLRAIQQGPQ